MVVPATMARGVDLQSNLVIYKNYARHLNEQTRRETWPEICQRIANMHIQRWPHLREEIQEALKGMEHKQLLGSMRTAQFAGDAILDKENRGYNCAYLPILDVECFGELLYNLLCGTGVGYSVQDLHIKHLPVMKGFAPGNHTFVVEDTIEGWCDALVHLITCCATGMTEPLFDTSKIRARNTLLVTSGGRAPGPKPLRQMLARAKRVLMKATKSGPRKLYDIEVHDICCHSADAVHAGGIRRAAMIAFFDRWSYDMLLCKSGDWWKRYEDGGNPQRGRANNSAVFVRGEVTRAEYLEFYKFVRDNMTGEPALYWTNDPNVLANPCVEIALWAFQFCNLSTVNGLTCKSEADFFWRVRMAARLGTLQAGYTNFRYLRSDWQDQTEAESLIGVSITGIGGGIVEKYNLKKAAAIVIDENVKMARRMGIKPAARTTCIKPEGNGSAVLGTSSGIHSWKADRYFRTIRVGKDLPVYHYLLNKIPDLVEDDMEKPDIQAVVRIPIEAGPGYRESDETPLDLLERVGHFHENWIQPGHISGPNTHNVSATVTVKPDEWDSVQNWKWENRHRYNGISAFPYYGGTHRQLPFAPCTKEEYDEASAYLNKTNIDFREVIELEDNTDLQGAVACAGGVCEIL